MRDKNDNNGIGRVIEALQRYITVQIDYARLTSAEKLTILLSGGGF